MKRSLLSSFKLFTVKVISAQPHTTLCIQFLDRENNDKNNTLPLGKQICFTIVWGCEEILPKEVCELCFSSVHVFITNGVSDPFLTSFLKSYLAYPHDKFLISRVAFYFKSFVLKIPLSLEKQNQSDFILYFPEHSAYQSRHCPYLDTIDRYSVANCWIFFDHVCNKLPHS